MAEKSRTRLLGECPVDENGREILLSLKNVDITFGKGDNAVRPSPTPPLTSTRARPSPWWASPAPERPPSAAP